VVGRAKSPAQVSWGGGHAALYTGELAASYAPELRIVGVAAAAPATYLAELFDADSASPTGKELTAMTIYSWSKLYHTPATALVEPDAMGAFETMAHDCIESLPEFKAITDAEKPLQSEKFLKANPTKTEPWRSVMLRNTPGQAPAGAPVLIAQGTADTTVRPGITKQFGEHLCKQGARLDLIWLKGVSHTFAARDSVRQTLSWIGDRFRGAPAPSSCR
jgi:pimeloyl-ACP methyl ester carboxylesterase